MQASGRIWHVIETIDLDMYDAAERVREHRERKEPLKAAAEKERAMLSKRLVTPDKVKTITAFARDMSDFVMESVKGGVILGHGVSLFRINVRLSGRQKCHSVRLPWYQMMT